MNTIQTTTPAQVVAPVGQTPPLQNQTAVDQTTTYNEGNGVMDTIVMTGPLSEIYTRALGVYFAKKPLDESALATESQAMSVARNTAITTGTDAGLREIANAVQLVTPQEVMGNVDATVYAVDYSQIDRPEVIDAMHRLRDRATASGMDYVMAAVVEPLKEVTPCYQGTNAVYEISPLENSLTRGADGGFTPANESYCGSLGFPIVYGLEGLASWVIDRQAKKGNKAALEHLNPAKEGFFDKVKSVFKKREPRPTDEQIYQKAIEALQSDGPVSVSLQNNVFGVLANPRVFTKALSELEGYIGHLPSHTKALVSNMYKHMDVILDLNTSIDLGLAQDNYARVFPEMKPIYEEYAKIADAKYLPRVVQKDNRTIYTFSNNGGMAYVTGEQYGRAMPTKFPAEMAKPNLERYDDMQENPIANVPKMGPLWSVATDSSDSVVVLDKADKQQLLNFLKKNQKTAHNLYSQFDHLNGHKALRCDTKYDGGELVDGEEEDERWTRYVCGINNWFQHDFNQGNYREYVHTLEDLVFTLAQGVKKLKPTHAMESRVATEGFMGDILAKIFGARKEPEKTLTWEEKIEKALILLKSDTAVAVQVNPRYYGIVNTTADVNRFLKEMTNYSQSLEKHFGQQLPLMKKYQEYLLEKDDPVGAVKQKLWGEFEKLAEAKYLPVSARGFFLTTSDGPYYAQQSNGKSEMEWTHRPPLLNSLHQGDNAHRGESNSIQLGDVGDRKAFIELFEKEYARLNKVYDRSMSDEVLDKRLVTIAQKFENEEDGPDHNDEEENVYEYVNDIYQGSYFGYISSTMLLIVHLAESVHTHATPKA